MKRIFIILTALLLLTQLNYSQPQVFVDDGNSSTTTLSANGTFTGTYRLIGDYSSILVQVRSNRSSATNGVRVEFANGSISKTMYFDKKSMWTYTANDSTTNFICPVLGAYYRVKYVNGTDSQTTFRLYTTLLKNPINNLSNADSILANLKESNQLLQTEIDLLKGSKYSGSFTDTTGIAGDTLNPTGCTKQYKLSLSVDSSASGIYISSTGTYTAPTRRQSVGKLTSGQTLTWTFSVADKPKFYWKSVSGVSKVTVQWGGY